MPASSPVPADRPTDASTHDHGGPAPCACASNESAPGPTGWRGVVARAPRVPLAIALVLLLALGYVLGGPVGAVLLGVGLVGYAVVVAAGWPALGRVERVLRVAVLVFLVGLALVRLFPR